MELCGTPEVTQILCFDLDRLMFFGIESYYDRTVLIENINEGYLGESGHGMNAEMNIYCLDRVYSNRSVLTS